MSETPIFLDANVLLEIILQYRSNVAKARYVIKTRQTILSPLTARQMVYFGLRDGLPLPLLLQYLEKHRFTNLGNEEIAWASRNAQDNDFDGALQVACAVLHGCREFATFDGGLAKRYGQFIEMTVL